MRKAVYLGAVDDRQQWDIVNDGPFKEEELVYQGKTYHRIRRNLFTEMSVNGVWLVAGEHVYILKFDKEVPYEELDWVYYGHLGRDDEEGFKLLYNTDEDEPLLSVVGLWARIPE